MTDVKKPETGRPGFRTIGFFTWFPWEKILIWGLFVLAVYALRHFFFVIFMTFMITYIMRNAVRSVMRVLSGTNERAWLQRLVAAGGFIVLIAFLSGVGFFLYHPLKDQATKLYNLVTLVDVEKGFNDILRETVGVVRFRAKYGNDLEKSPEYQAEFKKFVNEKQPKVKAEEFEEKVREFDRTFKAAQAKSLGEKRYQDLGGRADIDFYAWMFGKVDPDADPARDEIVKEWDEKRADFWIARNLPGKDRAEAEKLEAYQTARKSYVKEQLTSRQIQGKKDELLLQFKEFLGEAEFVKVGLPDLEGRHRTFYESWKTGVNLQYDYNRFGRLRAALETSPAALLLELAGAEDPNVPKEDDATAFRRYRAGQLAGEVVGDQQKAEIMGWVKKNWLAMGGFVANLGLDLVNLLIQFGFSLLLSFFIVFDLFRLRRMFQGLEKSRVKEFYGEIAPGLIAFGRLIGRSFQAQGVIALLNTLLTFTAIKILGIQNEVFLSAIVFICSFIPVLGVVISSVPVAAMALIQQAQGAPPAGIFNIESGLVLGLLAIAAILVVHFIETSILNPKIVGDMLHLHPVMVLAILAVGQYFFGVWGLLLGVPVSVYIFRYVILGEDMLVTTGAGHEPPPLRAPALAAPAVVPAAAPADPPRETAVQR